MPLVLDALLPELEVDLLADEAGLLTVDVVLLTVEAGLLTVEAVRLVVEVLLVLLPTLIPPRRVPVVVLTVLDGLFDDPPEWLPANAPLDSV